MALWPFRRKSVRKRSRSGATPSDNEVAPLCTQTDVGTTRTKSKKARDEPAKLQRRQRTYSFSPGRHDSIRIEGARGNTGRENLDGHAHNSASSNTADWGRTPTLHPTRRKSSKRRREDHDREAEIKAMSAFMPTRSATHSYGRSGSKQSTKRAKTGDLEHHYKPASQLSLLYPDSVLSAMSADSDSVAYKLSTLDSLAPRPTLKYNSGTRWTPSRTAVPGAAESTKKPLGDREPIHEDPLDSRKRIDDLADDLDAKDLRELMERDSRRRERKRIQDQERLEKRLARRAERNKRDKSEAMKSGSPPPENLERGVMGREMVGLGIDPASTVVTSSKRRDMGDPADDSTEADGTRRTQPLESFHRPETSPEDHDDAQLRGERTRLLGAGRIEVDKTISALPKGSKSTLGSEKDRLMDEESGRKNSESSNKTSNRLSLTSLLKWGSRSKRYSGPSSFSNTSREEMQASANPHNGAQADALARLQGDETFNQAHCLANKSTSTVPKRTKSRFREDLPEFPLSPPDSRMQSPETEPPLPVLAEKSPDLGTGSRSTPSPGHDSPPSAEERPQAIATKESHLSMSLASIDSEGSWLSGRVGSVRVPAKQDSLARINRREATHPSDSPTNSTREELAIADDEYLRQFAPDRNSGIMAAGQRPSGEGRPSSDDEESVANENLRWGRVGAKPEVIQYHHHDRDTMRSRQGLLNIDSGDEEDTRMPTPTSPV